MAQILDLGKLRFNWTGDYNGSTLYSYNDLVKYGPNLYVYKAVAASSGSTPPSDGAKWALVSEGIFWRGTYTAGTLYFENDLVTDGTSTFIVTVQHTSPTPAGLLPNANTTLVALGQSGLPNQAGQTNKVLTTNGTSTSWTATTYLSKTYTGNSQGQGAVNFETTADLTDAIAVFSGATSDFAQFSIVNTNNGANASTDFIAYTADGTNDTGWIDMGITSNDFDSETYGITGPHDGYIFMSGARGDTFEVVSRRTLAGVATLTTSLPHGFTNGNQVRVFGVGEGYDGLVTVTGAPTTITFTYAVTRLPESETAVSPVGETWKPDGDGNLVLATTENGKQNKIIFAAGGLTEGTTQMEITPNQNVHIEIATESTSSTTGALTVVGGVGVAGNLNVAGDLDVNGTVDFSGVSLLPIGSTANTFAAALTDPVVVITTAGGPSSFAQVAFRNSTSSSSTDIIAYMNNGTDTNGWVGMGITGSTFDDETYGITGPGDGYIFHDTLNDTYTGNLVFATGDSGSENKLIFAAGGFASGLTQMEITPGVNVHIEIPTASTSPTTGALTVVGGVGIQGDVNIQGSITFGGEGTQVGTANLAVEAPFIFTGDGSTSTTNDLGIVTEGKYTLPGLIPTRTVVNKSLVDNVATLQTSVPHLFLAGDSVVVAGVDATFNGTYTITAVTSDTFSYAKTAGNVVSARIGDQTFSINNKVLTAEVATLTTTATHPFLNGQTAVVTGVDSTFNGTYVITAVTSNTFSYAKPGASNVTSTAVSPVGTVVVNQSASTADVANPVRTRYNAWSKDATDGVWKLASNIITEPTTTIDYGQAGLVYDGIRVGSIQGTSLLLDSTITGGASSNIAINTNRFTVNASNGNTAVAGTLAVTGATTLTGGVNGALSASGNLAINTNQFTVDASNGNTAVAGTLSASGLATFNGGISSSGTLTFTGGASFSGTTDVQELREQVVAVSGTAPTLDWTQGNIYYWAASPGGAITVNLTNVPTDTNKIMTVNLIVTQDGTGRLPTTVNINGAGQTLRWAGGSAPTATANKIDVFGLTLLRTGAGAWVVLGSATVNF